MSDNSVDLVEFDRLRQEIDNRTQIANGLVGLQLTALGAGFTVFHAYPDVVIGLAVVSAFLWLLWIDHAGQIWKIAAYLSIDMAHRLRASSPGALGWESFYRRLDLGGADARAVLRLPSNGSDLVLPRTSNISLYISFVFGGTPVVLLAFAVVSQFDHMVGSARVVRLGAICIAVVVTVVALRAYLQFRRLTATIDAAIRASDGRTEAVDANG
jgi:hypothetical protein